MRKRNKQGRFISNEFKSLEIHQDKPTKPVNVVQIVLVMVIIFAVIIILDKCKIIDISYLSRL